jgi:hypothetical protein
MSDNSIFELFNVESTTGTLHSLSLINSNFSRESHHAILLTQPPISLSEFKLKNVIFDTMYMYNENAQVSLVRPSQNDTRITLDHVIVRNCTVSFP